MEGKVIMSEELIENIVSDCGYEALGLYCYLFSIRDKDTNCTLITIQEISNMGAYFDTLSLIESIDLLKEFQYILNDGDIYAFPKSIDYTDTIQMFKEFQEYKKNKKLV